MLSETNTWSLTDILKLATHVLQKRTSESKKLHALVLGAS